MDFHLAIFQIREDVLGNGVLLGICCSIPFGALQHMRHLQSDVVEFAVEHILPLITAENETSLAGVAVPTSPVSSPLSSIETSITFGGLA